jgi:hypothetical protein
MYENFKCWKYNSENGWVELQNMLLPTITWYMNWWGSYDPIRIISIYPGYDLPPNPRRLRTTKGVNSGNNNVFSGNKFLSDEVLQGLCYFVNYKNQIDEDAQVLPFLKDNNIFCYYGHSTNGNI